MKNSEELFSLMAIIISVSLLICGVFFMSCAEVETQEQQESSEQVSKETKKESPPVYETTTEFKGKKSPEGHYILTDPEMKKEAIEFTYDGCEYVRFAVGDKGYMSHKGNCKNPVHKHNVNQVANDSLIMYKRILDSIYFDTKAQIETINLLR